MKKVFISTLILLLSITYLHASPYADNYLYENMLDFIENQDKYRDNITNGYVFNNNSNIIVGAFIERAYSVYEKEEEYTPEFSKFFYMFAIAKEITGVLIQNPQVNDNIEYILKNKHISYKWYNQNKLIINIDNNKIEFIKDNKAITIKTDMKSLKKYRLN